MPRTHLIAICVLALALATGCGDDGVAPESESGLIGRVTDFSGAPVADAAIGLIFSVDQADVSAKPQTGIGFQLPDSSQVTLVILDAVENPVCNLLDGTLPGGSFTYLWDARDDQGARMPNGLYWYVLSVEGEEAARNPLFLCDPDPASLPDRANAHTDAAGNFRIPRGLVPTGVVIPVTDEPGDLIGDYPISRTVTLEVGRDNGGLVYNMETITLPVTWSRYEVDISIPELKPRD